MKEWVSGSCKLGFEFQLPNLLIIHSENIFLAFLNIRIIDISKNVVKRVINNSWGIFGTCLTFNVCELPLHTQHVRIWVNFKDKVKCYTVCLHLAGEASHHWILPPLGTLICLRLPSNL